MFLRAGHQDRLPGRLHADLCFELPAAESASLAEWLGFAAVSADVGAHGVIVRERANRVFGVADVEKVVREWMQAHSIDAVLASSDEALFVLSGNENGGGPGPRIARGRQAVPGIGSRILR